MFPIDPDVDTDLDPDLDPNLDPNLESATSRLRAAGCLAAEDEARELAAAARHDGDPAASLDALVVRRERGEPLSWITGRLRFCDRWITMLPGVFVPRPETEELARRAAALLRPAGSSWEQRGARALDLCCGSGAVATELLHAVPDAFVVGIDVDPAAARCARRNGVPTILGDVRRLPIAGDFDVVTAVAPYVPDSEFDFLPVDVRRHEPRQALLGGSDGLDLVRTVIETASALLRPGGSLLLAIGGDQDERIASTLRDRGFTSGLGWHDAEGDLRGLAARRSN